MELVVGPTGTIRAVYGEQIDLGSLGPLTIRRASHVEPDETGRWWADLSPAGGGLLGPFARRSEALQAERDWLNAAIAGDSMPSRAVSFPAPGLAP